MIEAVALSALLSCADGAWIIEGIGQARGMTPTEKYEVYREIRAVMPEYTLFQNTFKAIFEFWLT